MLGSEQYQQLEVPVKLLNKYKKTKVKGYNPRFSKEEQVAKNKKGSNFKKGRNKTSKKEIECFQCGEMGHDASKCSKAHTDSINEGIANMAVESDNDN